MRKYVIILGLLCCASAFSQPSAVLVTKSASDLIPEGITIDTRSGIIYVSSIDRHKIVAVDKDLNTTDFVSESSDGLMEALGMKIDSSKRLLWVTSIKKDGNLYHSKVHAFNLDSRKSVQEYRLKDTTNHLLNDLIIWNQGEIFVTDTYYGALYRIDPQRKNLEMFVKHPLLAYPNGIAQVDDRRLVVATYSNGPVLVDVKTKEVNKLPGAKDTAIAKGLDGLVLAGNKLYGVYNAGKTQGENAVVEYTLNAETNKIISERLIDRGNEHFRDPTTAAYAHGKLYVIANSFLTEYNQNKTSVKGIEKELKPVVILTYEVIVDEVK